MTSTIAPSGAPQSGLARRVLVAVFIYGLGDMITRAAAIVLVPLYTRYLTPEDYGILGGVGIFTNLIGMSLVLGLHGALSQFHFDTPQNRRDTLYGTLFLAAAIWGFMLTLILNTVAAPLVDQFLKSVRFDPYLRIATWSAFFSSLSLIPLNIIHIQQRPVLYRLLTTGSFFLSTGFVILLVAVYQWGVLGSLYGQLLANVLMGILYIAYMARNARWRIEWDVLRSALAYSFPLVFYSFGTWLNELSSRFFVERFVSLYELGLFNLAAQYCSLIGVAFSAINLAWVPTFYEIGRSKESYPLVASYALRLYACALTIALIAVLLSRPVISIFGGELFSPAAKYVPLLAIGAILSNVVWVTFANPLFLLKQTRHLMWLTLASGCLCVGFNYVLTPRYGALGAAGSLCCAYSVLSTLVALLSLRHYPAPYAFGKALLLTIFAAGLASVGVTMSFESARHEWMLAMALVLLFSVVQFQIGIVEQADLRRLLGWLRSRSQ